MGMPIMSDLHSPTVASTTPVVQDDTPLQELIRRKETLESELSALGSVLDSHGVTMATGLTTFDGFPRSDIDVAQIRTTRARIIHLRNDHKALMTRIEAGLHAHFADKEANPDPQLSSSAASSSRRAPGSSTSSSNGTTVPSRQSNGGISAGPAFAAVNSVSPNSPASEAGLVAGDQVQLFGDATWFNHEKLARVAQIVARSEGRDVKVTVLRKRRNADAASGGEEQLELVLRPNRNWGGRGMLGCHLLPL